MGQAARVLDQESQALHDLEGKYLTFTLANEDYGLEILKVREIIGMLDITAIPQAPTFFKGVINLRGRVIPVVDLRLKFGLPSMEYGERTCVIVVEVKTEMGSVQMGVVVDTVSEVVNVNGADIELPLPSVPVSTPDISWAWPRPGGPSRSCLISTGAWEPKNWPS